MDARGLKCEELGEGVKRSNLEELADWTQWAHKLWCSEGQSAPTEEVMTNATTSRRATVTCPFCDTLNRVDLDRLGDGPRCAACGRRLHLDRPQAVSARSLDRVVADTDVPVLIDFYADWCGPCRIMAPVLDQFARERAGEVIVGKLDTDRHPDAAVRFGVRGIPTLILFSGGREVARQVGAALRDGLDALFESLGAAPEAAS